MNGFLPVHHSHLWPHWCEMSQLLRLGNTDPLPFSFQCYRLLYGAQRQNQIRKALCLVSKRV